MADEFENGDDDLGNAYNGYPVYDPFSPNNNPSWISPEYGGGGGGTTTPFWFTAPDVDPPFGPPQEAGVDNPPAPAPPSPSAVPVKSLPPAAQGESAYDNNTVLIGIGVIAVAFLLLKK